MQLLFLGTRGGIVARSEQHHQHSALLIKHKNKKILIDCGTDWLAHIPTIKPDAILISHAHDDHAGGLLYGAPCPIYMIQKTRNNLQHYPINATVIKPYISYSIFGFNIMAYLVEHSLRAPAVGYKISDGKKTFFYVPDLVRIYRVKNALQNIDLYIGDGARITQPLVRQRGSVIIGHTSIREQVSWCVKNNVSQTIFTHCGSEIVKKPPEVTQEKIVRLQQEYHMPITIAYDGMQLIL